MIAPPSKDIRSPSRFIRSPPHGCERGLEEAVVYQYNFTNTLQLLQLPGGARIMDVACGAGWFSHFMARMGYETFGFDISSDFIELARRRLAEDPNLDIEPDELVRRFFVHNIEAAPLSSILHGSFSVVALESCLHHFIDPISAFEHRGRIGGLVAPQQHPTTPTATTGSTIIRAQSIKAPAIA
jgi:SAM-dependent methyltransferase